MGGVDLEVNMSLVGVEGWAVGVFFGGGFDVDRLQKKWLNKGRDETEASRLSALESYDIRKCTAQEQMELGRVSRPVGWSKGFAGPRGEGGRSEPNGARRK